MSGISALANTGKVLTYTSGGVEVGSRRFYGDGDAWPAVLARYASIDAMLGALNASVAGNSRPDTNPCAMVERFGGGGDPERMIRQFLASLFVSTTGDPVTFRERLWGLMSVAVDENLDGKLVDAVETVYLGEVVYTFADPLREFVAGKGLNQAETMAFTPAGANGSAVKVLTGVEMEVVSPSPPSGSGASLPRLAIFDVGPLTGILRVFRNDGGDGYNGWYALPLRGEWR